MPKTAPHRPTAAPSNPSAPPVARGSGAGADLALLGQSAYLDRLQAAVSEIYAGLSADRNEAVDAVEKTIAALARAEVPLDPAMKSVLIGKLAELLTKLERLQALLPQGESLALQSLDRTKTLLREMDQSEEP